LLLQEDRLGRGDPLAGEGADGQELQTPVGLDEAACRIAPQDEALVPASTRSVGGLAPPGMRLRASMVVGDPEVRDR